jgi:hypothetical protein
MAAWPGPELNHVAAYFVELGCSEKFRAKIIQHKTEPDQVMGLVDTQRFTRSS